MATFRSLNLQYRPLTDADISETYVAWLNDPHVNKYLEVRHQKHTKASVRLFVERMNASNVEYLFGIFTRIDSRHIGNVKIGAINSFYRTGEISLFIGDRDCWGKKLGREIIDRITKYGFDALGLHKIEAGCYESNYGSLAAFKACGYGVEGIQKQKVVVEGEREGLIRLGITRNGKNP